MAVKNTKAAEAAETVSQEQETAQAEQEVRLIYVGPTLPKGQLKANVVFVGTRSAIEAELAEALEKFPPIKSLLVPVENLASAKNKINTSGNALHEQYTRVVSLIEESLKEG